MLADIPVFTHCNINRHFERDPLNVIIKELWPRYELNWTFHRWKINLLSFGQTVTVTLFGHNVWHFCSAVSCHLSWTSRHNKVILAITSAWLIYWSSSLRLSLKCGPITTMQSHRLTERLQCLKNCSKVNRPTLGGLFHCLICGGCVLVLSFCLNFVRRLLACSSACKG